ncbi:uncharacterized protein LOC135389739 [Ornithodoros turicata]|uniref:uncharacterized protein LOC135389739 n=1 Tax=Ornithodoros turicata TaxID=34597 RepID=UPI003139D9EA
MDDFAVVHFRTENSIEVTPLSWVADDRLSVFWPPYSKMRIKRAIESSEIPEKTTWREITSVKIVFVGDYESAMREAEHAEYQTDLSARTDDESSQASADEHFVPSPKVARSSTQIQKPRKAYNAALTFHSQPALSRRNGVPHHQRKMTPGGKDTTVRRSSPVRSPSTSYVLDGMTIA